MSTTKPGCGGSASRSGPFLSNIVDMVLKHAETPIRPDGLMSFCTHWMCLFREPPLWLVLKGKQKETVPVLRHIHGK